MPSMTYPNQRLVRIHRERATTDFLGIKNENWMAAANDLGAHAFLLYLYLASNADNYLEALSPTAVRQQIGMARSTFHDQFHRLVDKGYLVPSHGNTYHFYEVPESATRHSTIVSSGRGECTEKNPAVGIDAPTGEHNVLAEEIEINNKDRQTTTRTNIGRFPSKEFVY